MTFCVVSEGNDVRAKEERVKKLSEYLESLPPEVFEVVYFCYTC